MSGASPLGDVVVAAWFVLAATAFWLPYGGTALPVGPLNALYAVFLLVSLAALALRLLRPSGSSGTETPAVRSPQSRREEGFRRGR